MFEFAAFRSAAKRRHSDSTSRAIDDTSIFAAAFSAIAARSAGACFLLAHIGTVNVSCPENQSSPLKGDPICPVPAWRCWYVRLTPQLGPLSAWTSLTLVSAMEIFAIANLTLWNERGFPSHSVSCRGGGWMSVSISIRLSIFALTAVSWACKFATSCATSARSISILAKRNTTALPAFISFRTTCCSSEYLRSRWRAREISCSRFTWSIRPIIKEARNRLCSYSNANSSDADFVLAFCSRARLIPLFGIDCWIPIDLWVGKKSSNAKVLIGTLFRPSEIIGSGRALSAFAKACIAADRSLSCWSVGCFNKRASIAEKSWGWKSIASELTAKGA